MPWSLAKVSHKIHGDSGSHMQRNNRDQFSIPSAPGPGFSLRDLFIQLTLIVSGPETQYRISDPRFLAYSES